MDERICNILKDAILDCISDIKSFILTSVEEGNDLLAVELYFESQPARKIMDNVIEKVLPHKRIIKEKKASFFYNKLELFEGLPPKKIKYYSNKIATLIEEDEDDCYSGLWDHFETMIMCAEKYKKVE